MKSVDQKKLYRVIDANFNRAKEGLRVCEDICRFLYDKKSLTGRYKKLRHELTSIIAGLQLTKLIKARDVAGDVGSGSSPVEFKRKNINDLFYANSQRAKESIRVLEEFTKLLDHRRAERLKRLRYQIYALERAMAILASSKIKS